MLVKITNIGSDQVHIPAYGKVLDPGGEVETQRTMADLHGDESLKALIASGDVSLVLTLEAGDSFAVLGDAPGDAPLVTDDAGRPAATAVPAGTVIFNTDDDAPNWSNGTDWKDAAGVTT